MIEDINLEALKREYNKFKESQDYAKRKSQTKFVEIAQLIIRELVKKNKITNQDLTSLIQILAANCKRDTFLRYLKGLKLPKDKEGIIYNKFITLGETGYTGRGRAAIKGLNENQLKAVLEFLKAVSEAKTKDQVKKAYEEYLNKKIPQVGRGIYSPWLYYLQPQICPLMAGPIATFFSKLGRGKEANYGELIDVFEKLNSELGEKDLGLLDQFLWDEKNRNKIFIKEKSPEYPSYSSLIENKKQIILYGPPGTGKTFRTKKIAIELLE